MTFWVIVAALLILGTALAWWSSGRAKPVHRRRDLNVAMEMRLGQDQQRNTAYGTDRMK
jgi:hypothetical protein